MAIDSNDWMPSDILTNETFKQYGYRKSMELQQLKMQMAQAWTPIKEYPKDDVMGPVWLRCLTTGCEGESSCGEHIHEPGGNTYVVLAIDGEDDEGYPAWIPAYFNLQTMDWEFAEYGKQVDDQVTHFAFVAMPSPDVFDHCESCTQDPCVCGEVEMND